MIAQGKPISACGIDNNAARIGECESPLLPSIFETSAGGASQTLALQPLIAALGTNEFVGLLFGGLAALTGAAHMSIIGFDDYLMPTVIAAESRGGIELARHAGNVYRSSLLYTRDPTRLCIVQGPMVTDGPIIGRLHASDILDRAYRDKIYDHYGLVERLSLLDQMDGRWYVVNLYRAVPDGSFDDNSVEFFSAHSGIISALVAKHLVLRPPTSNSPIKSPVEFEILVRGAAPILTPRQVQICARALMGMTNTGIGLDLGIQTSTVSTIRKRAYAAMGISSLNELFARCLVRPSVH
ncbi:helix-turn-helix transcriptional regulator [Rhizorhabdus dicambivorans]|nr:helix-turn-helix transcriptional regulator [Rhizorhabdus dicambivorans]